MTRRVAVMQWKAPALEPLDKPPIPFVGSISGPDRTDHARTAQATCALHVPHHAGPKQHHGLGSCPGKRLRVDAVRAVAVRNLEGLVMKDSPLLTSRKENSDSVPIRLGHTLVAGRPQYLGGVHINDELPVGFLARLPDGHNTVKVLTRTPHQRH